MKAIKILFILLGVSTFLSGASGKFIKEEGYRKVTYYVHPEKGSDSNKGISPESPLKSLEKINQLKLNPGDRILLASGQVFRGSLSLEQVSGDSARPVVISAYTEEGSPKMPVIDARGEEAAILLRNCKYIEVSDLSLTGKDKGERESDDRAVDKRCGVLILTDAAGRYEHIHLKGLHVEDVFFENPSFSRSLSETRSANGTQAYGWGIRVINRNQEAVLHDLLIDSCHIENVGHTGIKLTSRVSGTGNFGIRDFRITHNTVKFSGGPGIQMSGVKNGYIAHNRVNGSGSTNDSRKWGRGSGLWTWASSDILIEKNHFLNANGPGDSAGAHIDFNCKNVIMQYNFSANNAGGFCEILGNNYNCAYRYNISVNDGYRIKGENNAFQEGKTIWLSGYQGKNKKRSGPFNSYIYNNTILVSKDIVAKFAINRAASGILIANNIFYVEGETEWVLGDQYRPDKEGNWETENVVFTNNLYYKGYSWPADSPVQDLQPIIGDPGMEVFVSDRLDHYTPKNVGLVKNAGMEIHPVPMDTIGLKPGLKVELDILGNPVTGPPDLGAIELHLP